MKRMTLVFVFLAGCGVIEDDPPPPPGNEAYILKCDRLISTICQKVVSCSMLTDAGCQRELRDGLNCGLAVGVSDSYPRCLSEVQAASCQALAGLSGELVLPESCIGAVLVK